MTDIKSRLLKELPHHADSFTTMNEERSEAAAYIERLEAALRFISDNLGAHPANLAQYARNTLKGGNDE